jgi:hypothetical protein
VKFRTLLLGHHDEHAVERITQALDRMDPASRLATVLSIKPKEQALLWELCKDRAIDADHFVPSGTEPMKQVIHHGRNSLPAYNFFQKRFCLADDDTGDLYGYNFQSLTWATGPGYYVSHGTEDETDPPGTYVIDYTRIPPKKLQDWPPIMPNEAKLGRFVYAHMKDYMRGVSEHVSIGRAHKRGKAMNAWFILCREDAS